MTRAKVKLAVAEAERFIVAAEALLASTSMVPDDKTTLHECPWDGDGQPRLQGSARRASMDLTRALAEMRGVG